MTRIDGVAVLFLILAVSAACDPRCDASHSTSRLATLEFRIVLDEDQCLDDCEKIAFDSVLNGTEFIRAHRAPDLAIRREDIAMLIPIKEVRSDPDQPDRIVWSATVVFLPSAMEQVGDFGARLTSGARLAVALTGKPLGIINGDSVGPVVSLGTFPSRTDIVDRVAEPLGIPLSPDQQIDVFSPEEIEAHRDDRASVQRYELLLHEIETLREDAIHGKISSDEMNQRIGDLIRENSGR